MTPNEAEQMTLELLNQQGLRGWGFGLINNKRAFGCCDYARKMICVNGLWLARNDVKNESVIDTIRHEVAHACTPGAKHSWKWRIKAIELGAKPEACRNDGFVVAGRYEAKCPCNDRVYYFYRKVKRKYLCPRCRRVITIVDTRNYA